MMPEPSASSSLRTDRGAAAAPGRLRALAPWLYRALLAGVGALVLVRSLRAVWSFTIDDAGISYAYAKHIAEGWGPVAAPGAPWVEGYSNALWVFLLVPFHLVGLPLPEVAKVLGVVALVITLGAAMACLRPRDGRTWYMIGARDALYAVGLGASLECMIWVVAGLENALFACLAISLAALARSEHPRARAGAALAAFGLGITRPEGLLYAAAWLALELWGVRREPSRRGALRALLFFVTPLVLYHAVHYAVFRQLVPNTYVAKPASRDLAEGWRYLRAEVGNSGLIWVMPFAVAGAARNLRDKLLLLWFCCVGAVFVLYSGGDWMPHGRFVALFAPALLLLGVMGVENAAVVVQRLAGGRVQSEPLVVLLAAALGSVWWRHQSPRVEAAAAQRWCHFCDRVADSNRLRQLARRAGLRGVSLVTHDFGGPAWTSSAAFYPIDFLGLCDRSVALIRRDRVRRGGSIGDEPKLYQYLLHEQAPPPSLIYLPANFWPRLDRSPEYRASYVRLPRTSLPKAPGNTVLGLHRSEVVDYFPPTGRFERASLGPNLALLGWSAFLDAGGGVEGGELRAGSKLRIIVSLLSRAKSGDELQLSLRHALGDERAQGSPRALLPLPQLAREVGPGDPLSLEFALTVPAAPGSSLELQLGVAASREAATDDASWTFQPLGALPIGGRLSTVARALPRYPAALPSATDPELRGFQARVARLAEERRRTGDMTLGDRVLARHLIELGARLEAHDKAEQAYVAYVWATQAWRASWQQVADIIHRLRPPLDDGRQAMEILLLRDYYSSGDTSSLSRLVAFFVAERALTEIEYFLERVPDYQLPPELQAAIDGMRGETLVPHGTGALPAAIVHEPAAGMDFEAVSLDAWEGDRELFVSGGAAEHARRPTLRGQHGEGVLSSLRRGKRARGEILSPELTLDGARMSLLVAGSRRAGVELIVDGRAVASAHGNDSDALYPVLWDVSAYLGRSARLRVFDRDPKGHVLVDRVLSWR